MLSLSIDAGITTSILSSPAFPAGACADFGAALGPSLIAPEALSYYLGTTDPGQVTLGQLWSLPDPRNAARVIMNNDECMHDARPGDSTLFHWAPDAPFGTGGSTSYYADQCTVGGMPGSQWQQWGITYAVLGAAARRATLGGAEPDQWGPLMKGGIWTLFIQGTPETDCLVTPHSMISDESAALAILRSNWLSDKTNLNVVSGDFVEYTDLLKDAIAMDEALDITGPGYEVAFTANTGLMWGVGYDNHSEWRFGGVAGTSPAITALYGGGYKMAFHDYTGYLATADPSGSSITYGEAKMMAGTSPAIAALAGGGYEMAFQANTGDLWTVGTAGDKDWGLGMMAGTSPAIAALPGGGYEVAFQANTGSLWTVGAGGGSDLRGAWNLGMKAGTSPAIAAVIGGGYEVAFQANTGNLWSVGAGGGSDVHGPWGQAMMAGTSPAITGFDTGGYEMAVQTSTGSLLTLSSGNQSPSPGYQVQGYALMAGTSPAIINLPDGGRGGEGSGGR